MKRAYWDSMASDWEGQIFNTLAQDRGGAIRSAVTGLARKARSVADFGCGVGRYLPLLAESFDRVYGLDWSSACVAQSRLRARKLPNVEVLPTSPRVLAALQKACDVTLAVNVVIAPRKKARARALAQAVSLTKPGGFLLAVVPSLESVLYAEAVRKTFRPGVRSEFGFRAGDAYGDPGVLAIGGQPTKHYVAEEFALELRTAGCVPVEHRRVEYSWRVHDFGVPRHMRLPGPWDWLVVSRRE